MLKPVYGQLWTLKNDFQLKESKILNKEQNKKKKPTGKLFNIGDPNS